MNCIQRIAQQGNRLRPSLALTLSLLSNTVKKGNREISEPELRKTYLHFVEISIVIHARVKFVARDD